jgi:hypothetical protein
MGPSEQDPIYSIMMDYRGSYSMTGRGKGIEGDWLSLYAIDFVQMIASELFEISCLIKRKHIKNCVNYEDKPGLVKSVYTSISRRITSPMQVAMS